MVCCRYSLPKQSCLRVQHVLGRRRDDCRVGAAAAFVNSASQTKGKLYSIHWGWHKFVAISQTTFSFKCIFLKESIYFNQWWPRLLASHGLSDHCAGAVTIIPLLSLQIGDGLVSSKTSMCNFRGSRKPDVRRNGWYILFYPWNDCVKYDKKITDIYLTNGMFWNRYNKSNKQHWVIVTVRQRVLRVLDTYRSDSNCSKMIVTARPWRCVNIRCAKNI